MLRNQNSTVTVYGGTGAYLLLSNSNPGAIQSEINGSAVTLKGYANEGSAAITVCSSDISACGIINTVIGGVTSSGISLEETTPSMKVGETLTIPISGGVSGDYSIFLNTNDTLIRANLTSNSLILHGLDDGMAAITVCSSKGSCAATTATVTNAINSETGGPITLSQNNLWLLTSQSFGIKISGGSTPYFVPANSDNILKTSMDQNILNITALNPGSTSIDVCSAEGGAQAFRFLLMAQATIRP